MTLPVEAPAGGIQAGAIRPVARNAAALFVAYALPRGLTFLAAIAAARALGTSDFGAYGTAAAFAVILSIVATLGMIPLLVRELAQHPDRAPSLMRAAHWVKTGSNLVMLAAVVVLVRLLGYSAEVQWAAMLLAIAYAIGAYVENLAAYFQATERMHIWAQASGLYGLVTGLAGGAVVVATSNLLLFSAAPILGQAAALWWLLARLPSPIRRGAPASWADVQRLLYSLTPFAVSFVVLTVYAKVDVLLLAHWWPASEVGLYTAAYKFVDLTRALATVGAAAVYPRLSRASAAQGDDGRLAGARLLELGLLGAVPVAAVLWALRAPVIGLAFGPAYAGSVAVLAFLAAVLPALTLNVIALYVLAAARHMRWVAALYGATLAVNLALNLAFIPTRGAQGAALAMLISEWGLAAGLAWCAVRGAKRHAVSGARGRHGAAVRGERGGHGPVPLHRGPAATTPPTAHRPPAMRVLYISKALTVAAYRDKLRALRRHLDLTAVIPDRWRPAVEPVQDGEVLLWPVRLPGRPHLHLYREPHRLLAELRPDLIHVDEEPYSAVTWQLVRAARRRGVPAVFFAWQSIAKRLPPPFGWMRASVFRHAAGAIAGTERAAETLRQLGYRGPLAIVPQFGVDLDRFQPSLAHRRAQRAALGMREDEVLIGFAGRLVPEKGVRVLLQALARVPAARLVVLGDGPERGSLARLAAGSGLDGRVRFAGHQASTQMPAWLSALDLLVLPSLTTAHWAEQFGRVLVEAMACGVPVVGSDSGEIPKVIGDAGLVVPEGDAAALARALGALAQDGDLRARLAARGLERAKTHFTNQRIVEQTVTFYEDLV